MARLPAFVPVKTLIGVLGVCRSTAYKLAVEELQAFRVGGQLRVRVEVITQRYGPDVARACQEAA